MTKSIVIVSHSHVCRNPRVYKEAALLSADNYTVTILTAIHSDSLLREDRSLLEGTNIQYRFYSDLRTADFNSIFNRIQLKLFTYLQKHTGIESKFTLGYGPYKLKKICKDTKASLYIMHQELPTIIGCQLLKENFKIAFDFEDWYSEDQIPGTGKIRPQNLLRKVEAYALKNGEFAITTSGALANKLAKAYNCVKPHVIYNAFEHSSARLKQHRDVSPLKLYWFSQTTGPGRGIEFFLDCMSKSEFAWDLTLRGNISSPYKDLLIQRKSAKDRLTFLPLLKNDELQSDLNNYDIGLALEPSFPSNKNLTISNKLFHYMSVGLPVIASDTLGHLEIGSQNLTFIFMYENQNHKDLIRLLNRLGRSPASEIRNLKEHVIAVYKENYCWAIESQKLSAIVNKAINNGR